MRLYRTKHLNHIWQKTQNYWIVRNWHFTTMPLQNSVTTTSEYSSLWGFWHITTFRKMLNSIYGDASRKILKSYMRHYCIPKSNFMTLTVVGWRNWILLLKGRKPYSHNQQWSTLQTHYSWLVLSQNWRYWCKRNVFSARWQNSHGVLDVLREKFRGALFPLVEVSRIVSMSINLQRWSNWKLTFDKLWSSYW